MEFAVATSALARFLELAPERVGNVVDAFLRGGGDELQVDLLFSKLGAQRGIDLAHFRQVSFAQGDDFGAPGELRIETGELFAEGGVIAQRVAAFPRVE